MARAKKQEGFKLILPRGTRPPDVPPDHQKKPRQPLPVRMIIQSDDHHPIHDQCYEAALFAFAKDFQPDTWVHNGDRYDFWALSRFDKEPDRWRDKGLVQEELDSADKSWKEICRISERVHFIPGNHEDRLARLIKANPGLWGLRALNWHRLADIPDQVQIHPYGTTLEIGGLHIEHGDKIGGKLGVLHAAHWVLKDRMTNVVFGHTHRVETKYHTSRKDGKIIVAHNQGHGSDVSKQTYAGPRPNWQHGFTAVEFYTVGGKARFQIHPIVVVDGRFMFGGRLYDGRKWQ